MEDGRTASVPAPAGGEHTTAEHSALPVCSYSSSLHTAGTSYLLCGVRFWHHAQYSILMHRYQEGSRTVNKVQWVHFCSLQLGCPKDSKSIYTHVLIGRGLLHWPKHPKIYRAGQGQYRELMQSQESAGGLRSPLVVFLQ